MTAAWVLWFVLTLVGFAILELRAFSDKVPGTTLSAQVWRLRHNLAARIVLGGAAAWLGWHLASPWDQASGGWDDLLIIIAGAWLGAVLRYNSRSGL